MSRAAKYTPDQLKMLIDDAFMTTAQGESLTAREICGIAGLPDTHYQQIYVRRTLRPFVDKGVYEVVSDTRDPPYGLTNRRCHVYAYKRVE